MKRLTTRDESGYYHLRRGPNGGEINKITVVQHLGRLEDVALRPVSREQVEKAWRGEWKGVPKLGVYDMACSKCGYSPGIRFYSSEFCPNCGAPMTDEAVEMVMERLEEIKNES